MRTEDFNFYLPDALIAQSPSPLRNASRLLRLDGRDGRLADQQFQDLPQFLQTGDLLVFNDTRVIKARLPGMKTSGGKVEVLVERVLNENLALVHIRASKAPKPGQRLILANIINATVVDRRESFFLLHFDSDTSVLDLLAEYGKLPLPPYISHEANQFDDERYQTVYAKVPGAIAAPTAGLHFDEDMLTLLSARGVEIAYVTLHVGAGTFQPVRADKVSEHKMHRELYSVPESTVALIRATQERGGRVTAVGTTALRALESAALGGKLSAGSGDTDIFITPGYEFKVVERLLTNFHLPKSTLLMLISAFAGFEHVQRAYQHAIEQEYRFFSYGDAMLIERAG